MKNINRILLYTISLALLAANCGKKDAELPETAPVISGLDQQYYLIVRDELVLSPQVENRVDSVVWLLDGQRVANTAQYTFRAPAELGTFNIIVRAYNRSNFVQQIITITTGRFINVSTTPYAVLPLKPSLKFAGRSDIKWEVLSAPSELYRLTDTDTQTPLFISADKGAYQVKISSGNIADTMIISVQQDMTTRTPYITQVLDFLPAPGQFVNELPRYAEGDTHEDMVKKAGQSLKGENASMVSLGGWGGYVVFGFDHTIVNVAGRRDFRILGNAFAAASNPNPDAPFGGSCEPGIIMVAYDKNKNGKPDDDEWYEIKGSGNFTAENEPWYSMAVSNGKDVRTFRNYEMTYYKPAHETPEQAGEPDNPGSFATITNYIRWTDNQGQNGYKIKNVYHRQSYYPAWIKDDKIVYKGIRLARNGIDESGQGRYYVLYAFSYGYVDNYANTHDNTGIDIDWAIDKDGNKVTLPGIDFVKVYNGVDQENGWLGEASTEVGRGEDLHLLGVKIATNK
ncbi:hypothetical protein [Niabella aquatica]